MEQQENIYDGDIKTVEASISGDFGKLWLGQINIEN